MGGPLWSHIVREGRLSEATTAGVVKAPHGYGRPIGLSRVADQKVRVTLLRNGGLSGSRPRRCATASIAR